jgi:lipopolysaccharide assembly outer membrane protein LptD (OstA)
LLILLAAHPAITWAAAPRTIQLNADAVTALEGGSVLVARGHVIISDGQMTIRAEHVRLSRPARRAQLNGAAHITTLTLDLKAEDATVQFAKDGSIQTIQASGAVDARASGRRLTADRVAYQSQGETLTATGHVTATIPPDLVVTGGALVATGPHAVTVTGRPRVQIRDGYLEGDRLDAREQTPTALVSGHVVGVFQGSRITSSTATLLGGSHSVVFHKDVTVTQPGRIMTAETVTVYYQERRLVAEGPTTITIQETPP